MGQDATERPREVTTASILTGGAAAMLVISVLGAVGSLNKVEVRHQLAGVLAEGRWGTAGLEVDQVVAILRVSLLVTAICAAVVAVLAVFAARRDAKARLVLTVVSVPLVATGLLGGQLLAAMIPFAVGMLWSGRAGDWFAHRELRPQSQRPPAAGASQERPQSAAAARAGDGQTPAPASVDWAPPTGDPVALPRPGELVAACVVTWLLTGLTALLTALGAVTVLTMSDAQLREIIGPAMDRYPQVDTSVQSVATAVLVMLVLALLWSLVAAGLALATYRGSARGRVGLVLSSAWCALICLGMGFAAPVLWVVSMAAVVVVGLLRSPPTSRWLLTRRGRPRRDAPGPR